MLSTNILNRLQHGEVVEKDRYGKSVYRRIKASEARNSDGTSAGWIPNTPDGDRVCVQKAFTPKGSRKTTFTNYW